MQRSSSVATDEGKAVLREQRDGRLGEPSILGFPVKCATLLLVVCIPFLVRALYFPDYPGADDSFIHLAVIENIVAGGGWGINPGENVYLTTSPLFTWVFLGLSSLSSNLIVTGSGLSILASIAGICIVFWISLRQTSDFTTSLALACLVATNLHLWRWTGAFIETTFAFAFVCLLCAVFISTDPEGRRALGSFLLLGALVGLGATLRPEIGLLGIAFFCHTLLTNRRFLLRNYAASALGLALILGPVAWWAASEFGYLLPTTFGAKTTSGLILWNPRVARDAAIVFATGLPGFFGALVVASAFALRDWRKSKAELVRLRGYSVFLFVPLTFCLFYYLKAAGLESAGRYLLPTMGVAPLFLLAVVHSVGSATARRTLLLLAILGQSGLAAWINHTRTAPVLSGMWSGYVATMEEVAVQLDRHCTDGDTVLVLRDIGVLSWKHDKTCHIADGGGLASPELQGMEPAEMVRRIAPEFVVESLGQPGRDLEIEGFVLDKLFEREFRSHGIRNASGVMAARLYRVRDSNL